MRTEWCSEVNDAADEVATAAVMTVGSERSAFTLAKIATDAGPDVSRLTENDVSVTAPDQMADAVGSLPPSKVGHDENFAATSVPAIATTRTRLRSAATTTTGARQSNPAIATVAGRMARAATAAA